MMVVSDNVVSKSGYNCKLIAVISNINVKNSIGTLVFKSSRQTTIRMVELNFRDRTLI
jgi:hypothetical protein